MKVLVRSRFATELGDVFEHRSLGSTRKVVVVGFDPSGAAVVARWPLGLLGRLRLWATRALS